MYLKLKQATYDKLLNEANMSGMALASYINKKLEKDTIQQGEIKHERMDAKREVNTRRVG